jgi:capsular polysaccharide biosynthesis protein
MISPLAMKKIMAVLCFTVLLILAACSAQNPTTATIRITQERQSQPDADKFALEYQTTIIRSHFYLDHIVKTLSLSKLWGLSEDQSETKLRNAIIVQQGRETDLFLIEAKGLEHDLAVKILNELSTFYATQPLEMSAPGENPEKIHVSIVQPAK